MNEMGAILGGNLGPLGDGTRLMGEIRNIRHFWARADLMRLYGENSDSVVGWDAPVSQRPAFVLGVFWLGGFLGTVAARNNVGERGRCRKSEAWTEGTALRWDRLACVRFRFEKWMEIGGNCGDRASSGRAWLRKFLVSIGR